MTAGIPARLGYVWRRPRYVLMPDPEREKKTPNSLHAPWDKTILFSN